MKKLEAAKLELFLFSHSRRETWEFTLIVTIMYITMFLARITHRSDIQ